MKKEDIYNGITEIRDDLIEGAAKKRKRPQIWQTLVAAGLAAVIALGGFAVWRQWDIPKTGGGAPDCVKRHPSGKPPNPDFYAHAKNVRHCCRSYALTG